MAKSSTPTLSKYRVRYAALRFGAPLDDQRIEAIADPFDRERCSAFIEYKRATVATWHKFTLADFGAPFGTADQRAEADEYTRAENARVESWHRQQIQFSALVRAKGFADLLSPFDDDDTEAPVEFGNRLDEPAPAALLPEWSAATVHSRFTTMNEWREKYLCLLHGSASETVEGVSAENRAEFERHVEYHSQARQALFESACNEHGSVSGFFEDISATQKPAALFDLESRIVRFADGCKYELELLRISTREAASELVAEFG